MGLEMVDIVIQTENAFNISIADEDAEKLATVGQYYDYVLQTLGCSARTRCMSGVAFYRLRRAFCERVGILRSDFLLDASLDNLLPLQSRRKVWADLAEASDLPLPPLVRPEWVGKTMLAGAGGFAVAALLFRSWLLLIGVLTFPFALHYMTVPLATRIPQSMQTVRSAVKYLWPTNASRLAEDDRTWNEREVWEVLVGIIANTLRIDPKEVTRQAHFVADLGAG